MPAGATLAIKNIRLIKKGITDSFEELCCQLHRRQPDMAVDSVFRRIRGDGGDGGVESTWTYRNGSVWGLQAKYFAALTASEKAQLAESIDQAVANYPCLKRYTICLPFVLTGKTGAKSKRPRDGQHATLTAWITEWSDALKAAGRDVVIDWWDESEVLSRLAAVDVTGGLRRYWFDQTVLTDRWFEERWQEARAQAGARYTPKLNVTTPLDISLQTFAQPGAWQAKIEERGVELENVVEWWDRCITGKYHGIEAIPADLISDGRALLTLGRALSDELNIGVNGGAIPTGESFQTKLREAKEAARELELPLVDRLVAKYGPNADTPGFRQFRAEMQCDFPMASLDYLRKLQGQLDAVDYLASQPDGRLPQSLTMLVTGEAGIGKTHAIVDSAAKLREAGQQSVVMYGEDFDAEPWSVIAAKLGFGTAMPREELLDAFEAAGEATGMALIIFIDAVNETQPNRRKWASWLATMVEQIRRRRFVKLCVSCREIYVRECIPTELKIPTIVHNGFLGREYEAQFAFFQHYGVGLPAEPLLQSEFANPLFLRLVCETLAATGSQAAPVGRDGIRSLINLLLSAKNRKIAEHCDYDGRENRVKTAMLSLAGAMAISRSRSLNLEAAKAAVAKANDSSGDLFAALESEALISVVEVPPKSLLEDTSYLVRFTFERISDHLIVEYLLTGVTDAKAAFVAGGALAFLFAAGTTVFAGAGLLEALSVHLPETHAIELADAVPPAEFDAVVGYFLSGLQWRLPSSLTERTEELVLETLSNDFADDAFSAILSLAARPDNRLNSDFLHAVLAALPMTTRDPAWCSLLFKNYSDWGETVDDASLIYRLIEAARRGDLKALPDTVAVLWSQTLAWFCASSDRRLRDRSTMGMVHIFRARPTCILEVIGRFTDVDDEYIIERVLAAAYGALLLNPNAETIHAVAAHVFQVFFSAKNPPLNVNLRDHARLLIDLTVDIGRPLDGVAPVDYQPPYASPWPLAVPSQNASEVYSKDRVRFPNMRLDESMGLALGTDFARYEIEPRVLNAFDFRGTGISKVDIFRWFITSAAALGYPGEGDACAQFDKKIVGTFGGGRGKPGWAERLGKKYYWILLSRLVGQVADHLPRTQWVGSPLPPGSDLQGMQCRDIDVTDLRGYESSPDTMTDWMSVSPYVFTGPQDLATDKDWVNEREMPPIDAGVTLTDPSRDAGCR